MLCFLSFNPMTAEEIHVSAIPVIDVASLLDGSPQQARDVAKALGTACREVGFEPRVVIIKHMSESQVVIEDLHATIYHALGISPRLAYEVERRPFYVTRDGLGKPVLDLFA